MKGFKVLIIGALLFAVASVCATDYILKDHSTVHYQLPEIQPAVLDHQEFDLVRYDSEVLVIKHENVVLPKIAKTVIPVANAPPEV